MATRHIRQGLATAAILLLSSAAAQATSIMPDFADVPTGWVTDRYEPDAFVNAGTVLGRDNVLLIQISEAQGYNNRPAGFQSSFYNTQGRKHTAPGTAGDILAADLYVPMSWSDEANGTVRTGMWGVMTDGLAISSFPILGFTNEDDNARFRLWDSTANAWVDLMDAVLYDAWNSLAIEFTGTAFNYYVNDVLAHTDVDVDGSTGFQDVIMQAYNYFGDPAITGATPIGYEAHWANTLNVPEPGTLAVLGFGLVGLGFVRRRRAG